MLLVKIFSKLKGMLRHCELVIEVLDARDVHGTRLGLLEHWAGGERIIRVANKADLADKETIKALKKYDYVLLNSKSIYLEKERKKILDAILAKTKIRPLRIVVVGYPNVGKSTIINMLAKRKVARAGPVAGTTKNIQWIRVSPEVLLMDSPGVFPVYEDRVSLLKKGAVNISELDDPDVHAHRIAKSCVEDPGLRKWLSVYFDITLCSDNTPEQVLEKIAKRRNWLLKKGELNVLEASKALLRAYHMAPKIL